jgi:hypothetical protein
LDFDDVVALRSHNAAWRLLRADHAPLILSFLGRIFIEENVRSISATELVGRLDDELFALNERLGQGTYPKPAKAYLDDWASPEAGWLRKFYPPGSDEPHFDATPAVERALSWVKNLQVRSFVGTESRLNTIFSLLREMVFGAEHDPSVRLGELNRRRRELDDEIARVAEGRFTVLEASAQRDRYQQFATMARELLSDFREVEANFRALDRELRERIAGWSGAKGELLDDVLGSRELISDSDQGRSFQAFYDLLLSHQRQAELTELIERVQWLPEVGEPDPRMRRIHYDWLDAGERTQATVRLLSAQLRRFLDDQVWFENRRVMDILRSIEATALRLRDHPGVEVTMVLDDPRPAVHLPMERPLFAPSQTSRITAVDIEINQETIDAAALFEQVHVDPAQLCDGVRRALRGRSQVGLISLLEQHPLEQGLAELLTYMSLSDATFRIVFDNQVRERVRWCDPDGRHLAATLPRVTFARAPAASTSTGGDR